MIDLPSKNDIEKISFDLLKQSKSIDIFPTPVDNIVQYANLYIEKKIDLSRINQSFLSKLTETAATKFIEAFEQVRGFIDRREKVIYLDLSQNQQRQNFIKLHEVGHDTLFWQKKILEHLDDDHTLDPATQEEFEAEANYFASVTLFQHDRFEREIKSLELSIKTPMYLAKKFGASVHASLRRYVECSKKRCALLVLENISQKGEFPQCKKRDFFQSSKFTDSFGEIYIPCIFGYKWPFTQDYYHRKKYHENGFVNLSTENGDVEFKYHFFNNSFNAFIFLFPLGEVNKTRTKIVMTP